MKRPNILYLHSHDTGRCIQPYGHAAPTPNLQRLAGQGALFRQGFCAAPTCSPSRASLLTGQSAHGCGMIGLAHRGFALTDYRRHIVHTLGKAGYLSALCGQQHVAKDRSVIGYDHLAPETAEHCERDQVVAAARRFLAERHGRPFFLDVGFVETHRAFPPPTPRQDPRYCLPPAWLPDAPRTRADMAAFYRSAELLDEAAGDVLGALDAASLAEDTLVICTTDHGIAFPLAKCNLTDRGIGVMLILRGPGGFAGGKVIDGMVSHIDLFPTVCDLLGIDRPAWLEGKSLLPLAAGEAKEVNEEVFAEVTYHAAYEPQRCVRTRRWKYIRRFEDRGHPILPNCDDGPSKSLLLEAGWGSVRPAMEQLYDLALDPNETVNLAGAPAQAAVLAEMRGRLERWMRRTADPLLAGAVPAPPGARVNDPDGLSPSEPPRAF